MVNVNMKINISGCIFFELHFNQIMFFGTSEEDQLNIIFANVTRPDWKAIATIPAYKAWCAELIPSLGQSLNQYGGAAVDFLNRLLELDLDTRIIANDALIHPYFHDYNPYLKNEFGLNDVELSEANWKNYEQQMQQYYTNTNPEDSDDEVLHFCEYQLTFS